MHNVEKKVQKALRLLRDRKPHAYERARKALPSGTCEWWEETLEIESDDAWDEDDEENNYQATPESLAKFLETEVLPWVEQRTTALTYRTEIRLQAFGEALMVHELVNLARYEAHLTTQFRQTLAMLIELQQRRQESIT